MLGKEGVESWEWKRGSGVLRVEEGVGLGSGRGSGSWEWLESWESWEWKKREWSLKSGKEGVESWEWKRGCGVFKSGRERELRRMEYCLSNSLPFH